MNEPKKILHKLTHMEPEPEFFLNYILLPVGYNYNSKIAVAKKGENMRFFNGGTYPIYSVRRIKIGSPAADILCRMRYGVTIKRVLRKWQLNAKLEGNGMKAISTDECLWVIYGNDDTVQV